MRLENAPLIYCFFIWGIEIFALINGWTLMLLLMFNISLFAGFVCYLNICTRTGVPI